MMSGFSAVADIFVQIFLQCFSEILKKNGDIEILTNAATQYKKYLKERFRTIQLYNMEEEAKFKSLYIDAKLIWERKHQKILSYYDVGESIDDSDSQVMYEKTETISGLNLIKKINKSVIIAPPGYGKTSCLRNLLLDTLDGKIKELTIPIFVYFRELPNNNDEINIFDALLNEFNVCDWLSSNKKEDLKKLFIKGNLLVLLDGLDEVDRATRQKIIPQIEKLTSLYPLNKYVVTCRNRVFENLKIRGFKEIEISEFGRDSIQKFIQNWFYIDRKIQVIQKKKLSDDCFNQIISNHFLFEMAKTPLLLTLLCAFYKRILDFPTNTSEVFEDGINALIIHWDTSRQIKRTSNIPDDIAKRFTHNKKDLLYSIVAWEIATNNFSDIRLEVLDRIAKIFFADLNIREDILTFLDARAFFEELEEHHSILIRKSKNFFTFKHITFHHYFSAKYYKEYHRSVDSHEDIVKKYIAKKEWGEIFKFIVELLPESDFLISRVRAYVKTILRVEPSFHILLKINSSIQYVSEFDVEQCFLRSLGLYFYFWDYKKYLTDHDKELNLFVLIDETRELAVNIRKYIIKNQGIKIPWIPEFGQNSILRDYFKIQRESITDLLSSRLTKDMIHNFRDYIYVNRILIEMLSRDIVLSPTFRKSCIENLLTVND